MNKVFIHLQTRLYTKKDINKEYQLNSDHYILDKASASVGFPHQLAPHITLTLQ